MTFTTDVAYWVGWWTHSGDIIPAVIARKIAEYWYNGETPSLREFVLTGYLDDEIRYEVKALTILARLTDTEEHIYELYALKAYISEKGF